MRFSIMLGDGKRVMIEAGGWAEVARDAELQFGRLNIRLILKSDDELPDSMQGVEKIAKERYATEKWVKAYGDELRVKEETRNALEYLMSSINMQKGD